MIKYPRTNHAAAAPLNIRLIGLGNAGVHLADRIAMSGTSGIDVMAMNTDSQSLASSVASLKIALGQQATRGLGTGGDPEVGFQAAQESLDEIRAAVEGANLVFLCAGLGGGTASGIAPVVAEAASDSGAVVFSIVTSPFAFEGKRRFSQAVEALDALAEHSHAVIHFENDRMADLASPRAGIEETFSASDALLAACVTSLLEILRGGTPMPIGLGDLLSAVGGGSTTTLFGRGESSGDNRAHEALERALKSPLLDRGRLLDESHAVIAHISGPASLSFSEVAAIMRELGKHTSEKAQLHLGVTTTHSDQSAPVSVTILGNYSTETAVHRHDAVSHVARPEPKRHPAAPHAGTAREVQKPDGREESKPLFTDTASHGAGEKPALAGRIPREPRPEHPAKPVAPAQAKSKQETLPFDAARGRFEKSEPTIVEGEDLDVPTFLRMRGKSK